MKTLEIKLCRVHEQEVKDLKEKLAQLTIDANQYGKEIWLLKCKAGEHERKLNDSKRQDAKRLHKYKKFKK